MAKNGKKWQKMAKIVFFYIFKYILLFNNKGTLTELIMSYAAAVVSAGATARAPARAPAPAPVAPAPVAPSPATAKNAPEPEHRCNVGHCNLCNMIRDQNGYGVLWTIDEDGNKSGM